MPCLPSSCEGRSKEERSMAPPLTQPHFKARGALEREPKVADLRAEPHAPDRFVLSTGPCIEQVLRAC